MSMMEDRSYYSDRRVIAGQAWRPDFDESRMRLTFEIDGCMCNECDEKYPPYTLTISQGDFYQAFDPADETDSYRRKYGQPVRREPLGYGVVHRRELGTEGPDFVEWFTIRDERGHIDYTTSRSDAEHHLRELTIATGFDPDWDGIHTIELPAKFVVCDTCDGRGSHVNPSVDAHGLSREDFDDDPDFRDDYRAGVFDMECAGCGGRRVVPVPDEDACSTKALKAYDEQIRSNADFRAEQRAERMMGA